MKVLSWNVNGIRSAIDRGLLDLVNSLEYDVLLLQEVRSDVVPLGFDPSYYAYLNPSKRRGYSGTLTLTRLKPLSAIYGIGDERFDSEGRVITIELDDFFVVNAYFPNAQEDLRRLKFKLEFDGKFEEFVQGLRKPVVIGGDFNVAREEIDVARPEESAGHAGFTLEEREWMKHFLGLGYVDTFRMFVKEGGHYTWWSYRLRARERNEGWRIDYILVSASLAPRVKGAGILEEVEGSDHAPVYAEIERSGSGAQPDYLDDLAGLWARRAKPY